MSEQQENITSSNEVSVLGQDVNVQSEQGQDIPLSINASDIKDMAMDNQGNLKISYAGEDGTETLSIQNFSDIAGDGTCLRLADGTQLQTDDLYNDLCNDMGVCVVEKPDAGDALDVPLATDKQYDLKFDVADSEAISQESSEVGDALTVTFDDGAQITFQTTAEMIEEGIDDGNAASAVDTASAKFLSAMGVIESLVAQMESLEQQYAESQGTDEAAAIELASVEDDLASQLSSLEPAAGDDLAQTAPDEAQLESSQPPIVDNVSHVDDVQNLHSEIVQDIENAGVDLDAVAEQLAGVTPAAGGDGGGSAAGSARGGFGFQSSFDAQGVIPIEDVGPINPTQLEYGIELRNDELGLDDPESFEPVNGVPSINGDTRLLDETSGLAINDTGILNFDFGSDGGGSIVTNDTFTASGSLAGGDLFSGGNRVTVTATSSGYVGVANGQVVFTFDIDPQTGAYDYMQVLPFDHADANDPNDAITLDFGVQIIDGNGDIAETSVVITVLDDAPISIDAPEVTVDETGVLSASGTVAVDFGQDGVGSISGNGASNIGTITSNGNPVTVTFDATTNTYTGVANGSDVFTLAIASDGSYDFVLSGTLDHPNTNNPNDSLSLSFGVLATDADGDAIETTIQVNVLDDGPEILNITSAMVDESDLAPDTSVSGQINIDFGQDGAGEVGGSGVLPTQVLTSNGQPVTVTFDSTTSTYTGVANGASIFTLVIASDGSYDFVLSGTLDHPDTNNPNEAIALDFGVMVTDADGDSVTGTLTINVLDDAPVAHGDVAIFETSQNSVDGNVVANDDLSQDQPNNVTQISFDGTTIDVPETGTASIDGDFGSLVIAADGSYIYTLFNGSGGNGGNDISCLDPRPADVDGLQSSLTLDGITVSVANQGNFDLVWLDTSDGSGIGIDNLDTNDSFKVFPRGETFDIDLDRNAQSVTLTIAEIGSNSDFGEHGVDFLVTLADGSTVAGEQQLVPGQIIDGVFSFDLSAADYGQEIASIALNSTNDGAFKGASFLLNNVKATYGHSGDMCDEFDYTLTDADGDSSVATLSIKGLEPKLIVGENVDDVSRSTVDHHIGGEEGAILGDMASDILIGDVGGASIKEQTQDYNFVFVVDVSGSMGSASDPNSKISQLKGAVDKLLHDFDGYTGGEIKVHITPFSTDVKPSGTFTLTDAGGLTSALAYVETLTGGGYTNYESPLQEVNGWLQSGDPIGGDAITTTYFISDGAPNKYLDDDGNIQYADSATVLNEITGSDGTDEVSLLHSLNDDVIAVGIQTSDSVMDRLDIIDLDGDALALNDPSDLTVVFQDTSPLYDLAAVGDDVIEGSSGDDIIFGDSVNTDGLAQDQGVSAEAAEGWDIFDRLESGEGLNTTWSRDDTIDYIQQNHEDLSAESVAPDGSVRVGGDDILNGGDGDDVIYGQEGNDVITGGAGRDILSGGSGADAFVLDALGQGIDVIRDFDTGEGDVIDLGGVIQNYDSTQQAIDDFVFTREENGGTVLSVDASGSGNAANAIDLVALDGIQNIDIQSLFNDGNIAV